MHFKKRYLVFQFSEGKTEEYKNQLLADFYI